MNEMPKLSAAKSLIISLRNQGCSNDEIINRLRDVGIPEHEMIKIVENIIRSERSPRRSISRRIHNTDVLDKFVYGKFSLGLLLLVIGSICTFIIIR